MRIAVIAGPPCAGKTTLAHTVAQPGDVVLDFDDFARASGSPALWLHPEPYRSQAEYAMQCAIAQAYSSQESGTAWVLRYAARPSVRASLAATWSAEVYVLDPGEAECQRRAASRPRGTSWSIRSWYRSYRPQPGDCDAKSLHNYASTMHTD